jgi:glucan biosynthesis protein C
VEAQEGRSPQLKLTMLPLTSGPAKPREHFVDWLRVFATGMVLLFHCARFFDAEGWHVKNPDRSTVLGVFVSFSVQWMMPLFFILSAISIRHALARRSNGQYMLERLRRLGVPFVFGTLVLIPPQVYIERATQGDFTGSFFAFLPHSFEGWYGFGGNFAWMGLHLWYLEVLLILSFLTLPVFRWLARPAMSQRIRTAATVLARPGAIYGLALPIAAMEMLVNLQPDGMGRRDFGGWSVLTYWVFFLLGYVIGSDRQFRAAAERQRHVALALGITAASALYALTTSGHSDRVWPLALLRAINSWSWLLVFLSYASKHLGFDRPSLRRANEAVLPFYVLHQTVIVVIAFLLMGWRAGVAMKYAALVVASLTIILSLYAFGIRRWGVTRFLFGMHPAR